MIHKQGTDWAKLDPFDRTKKHVMAADCSHIDQAAVEGYHSCPENWTASGQYRPTVTRKPIGTSDAGAAGKEISDSDFAVSQRVDAEHAIFQHDRIGLAASIKTHKQRWRAIRH